MDEETFELFCHVAGISLVDAYKEFKPTQQEITHMIECLLESAKRMEIITAKIVGESPNANRQ